MVVIRCGYEKDDDIPYALPMHDTNTRLNATNGMFSISSRE